MENVHDQEYLRVLGNILANGINRPNRTGVGSKALPAAMMQFDLSYGFPLLTLKKMAWKTIRVELEGFIKGITDKVWFQDRGCRIWDEWCNPSKVPYGHDEATKARMREERDLGPIYGYQWRNFGGYTRPEQDIADHVHGTGVDQLRNVLTSLEKTPDNRRMVVSAWNPIDQPYMALPPCHSLWQVLVIGERLHLNWYQRSCDWFLGVPFNVASYALLTSLLARHSGLLPGVVTGFFGDSHVYDNHLDAVEELVSHESFSPPKLLLHGDTNILSWTHDRAELVDYECHGAIKAEVAV